MSGSNFPGLFSETFWGMCEWSLSDGNGEADHVGVKNEAPEKGKMGDGVRPGKHIDSRNNQLL